MAGSRAAMSPSSVCIRCPSPMVLGLIVRIFRAPSVRIVSGSFTCHYGASSTISDRTDSVGATRRCVCGARMTWPVSPASARKSSR